MDVGAYVQIENLRPVMTENNIYVPQLRGIRLMSEEEPASQEDIAKYIKTMALINCDEACRSNFSYNPSCYTFSPATYRLERKYLIYDGIKLVDVRWDKIHGKKRKLFKYLFKRANKRVTENFATYNKYCGREDILYIQARIGGNNWPYYCKAIKDQPWFIEKVDDPYDSTYCNIYAKIKPILNT